MRKPGAAIAALVSVPVLLAGSSALALDITFDQATGVAGGAALGAVGGPLGGLIGGLLGRAIGRKIDPQPRQVDLSDLRSTPHVTPIEDRTIMNTPGEDRAVDSTPIRMVEVRPAEADAQTYLASAPAPRRPAEARRYLATAHLRTSHARTYLAAAPRSAPPPDVADAILVSRSGSDDPGVGSGTLDGQLKQLNARRSAEGLPQVQQIADAR